MSCFTVGFVSFSVTNALLISGHRGTLPTLAPMIVSKPSLLDFCMTLTAPLALVFKPFSAIFEFLGSHESLKELWFYMWRHAKQKWISNIIKKAHAMWACRQLVHS